MVWENKECVIYKFLEHRESIIYELILELK